MPKVRLIKHKAVKDRGSYEIRVPDGWPSRYFHREDVPGRRLNPNLVDSERALERARTIARAESDRLLDAKR